MRAFVRGKIRGNKPLQMSLLLGLSYCFMRSIVYFLASKLTNSSEILDWVIRDFAMNAPRLLLIFGTVAIWRKYFGPCPSEPVLKKAKEVLFTTALVIVAIFADAGTFGKINFSFYEGYGLFVLSTAIVGLAEEVFFRGLLLRALLGSFSRNSSIILGALIFMVWHVQAQPLINFPYCFAFGVTWSVLRLQGASLFVLSLGHFLVDLPYALFFYDESSNPDAVAYSTAVAFLIAITYFLHKPTKFSEN